MAGKAPTTDQLRDRVDSGETADKVDFPDPAAAPLGTDTEAAGAPPGRRERRMAAVALPRLVRSGDPGLAIYGAAVGFVTLVLLAILVLTP